MVVSSSYWCRLTTLNRPFNDRTSLNLDVFWVKAVGRYFYWVNFCRKTKRCVYCAHRLVDFVFLFIFSLFCLHLFDLLSLFIFKDTFLSSFIWVIARILRRYTRCKCSTFLYCLSSLKSHDWICKSWMLTKHALSLLIIHLLFKYLF